jgi:hypothetical protein
MNSGLLCSTNVNGEIFNGSSKKSLRQRMRLRGQKSSEKAS